MTMTKKKNSFWVLALTTLLLSACSANEKHPQFAQSAHPPVINNEVMVETCKHEAAHRYNTRAQRISVLDMKQYQGSFEIKGATTRAESFTCSFDENGQFLHLSTV